MKLSVAIAIIVVIVVLVLLYMFRGRKDKKDEYVIGAPRAKAVEAEQRRIAKGDAGKSPMQDKKYDFWHGEESLISPVQNQLDTMLGELCQSFANSDAQARASIRRAISLEEFDTLLTFSRRAAIFAIRQQNSNWINNGLSAIAMIEYERTDFRDIFIALGLLYHSATRIGQNADQVFQNASALCEPNVSKIMIEFTRRPLGDKVLRAWGYDEVETKDGIGLIGWDFKDYNPTYDLKKIALEIGDLIGTDKYQPQFISVGSEFPPYWLQSDKNDTSAEKALREVRAGGSISALLRPNEHPKHDSQILMVFFVEVADENTAQALMDMSKKKKSSDYCMMGLAEGRLFCLVVARSFEVGVESFETPESVRRFSKGIAAILSRYAGSSKNLSSLR